MVGNSKVDVVLLDEMINNIQFIFGDFICVVNDSVKFIVEIVFDVNNLLRQYVVFVSQCVVSYLNDELKGVWVVCIIQMKVQVKRQEEVAKVIYDRWMNSIEQVLKIVEQYNILCSVIDVFVEELFDLEMFLFGCLMFQV